MTMPAESALELWGGIECTVNRVGDRFIDQLERGGHAERDADLDLLASLGIRTARYPLLWERIAPNGVQHADWEWADARISALFERGIDPIVGLLHHGSGPRFTSLVDPDFAGRLAEYAGAVARRYPWITYYTPINEPLTTARFSTLYGHWYPHGRHDRLFARAVVNQLRATILAMRAIRKVNPAARLVQTEDLGKTYSTPRLEYQADFENERRWLTFDALCGTLDRGTAMWRFLAGCGIPAPELDQLRDECCPPDVIGLNHYITSERFLDERLDRYPTCTHGGNGRDTYADVEAIRVLADDNGGPGGVLADTWQRYHRPLALTEIHIAAPREDQLRWLDEAWRSTQQLRDNGVDVRAVTAWSLFGAFDWHTLLTRAEGRYESGAFDVRAPEPRPTALATMVRTLAHTGSFDHPVLHGHGWWRRQTRLIYPVVHGGADRSRLGAVPRHQPGVARPILITGGAGTLGRAFATICAERALAHRRCTRRELDICNSSEIETILTDLNPWAIVNAAGYVRVDDAERDRDACYRDNCQGPLALAKMCRTHGVELLTFSSDLVFDGTRARPYIEGDRPQPLSVYGRSKADAEQAVCDALPGALVVRTSAFFGPWDDHNFVAHALRTLGAHVPFAAPCDEVVSPTFVPDLVHACLDLLIDGERGIWHLANQGATTWADLARVAATRSGLDSSLVIPCAGHSLPRVARRPRYSVLASERGLVMPPLDDAITRYFAARAACMQPVEAA
jgi:dTDP-4-dehydrorhamnose reductase